MKMAAITEKKAVIANQTTKEVPNIEASHEQCVRPNTGDTSVWMKSGVSEFPTST